MYGTLALVLPLSSDVHYTTHKIRIRTPLFCQSSISLLLYSTINHIPASVLHHHHPYPYHPVILYIPVIVQIPATLSLPISLPLFKSQPLFKSLPSFSLDMDECVTCWLMRTVHSSVSHKVFGCCWRIQFFQTVLYIRPPMSMLS